MLRRGRGSEEPEREGEVDISVVIGLLGWGRKTEVAESEEERDWSRRYKKIDRRCIGEIGLELKVPKMKVPQIPQDIGHLSIG